MTFDEHIALFVVVNEYVRACGGSPPTSTFGGDVAKKHRDIITVVDAIVRGPAKETEHG